MQEKKLRVVIYLNQFFGGMGGEDKADMTPRAQDGPVGPGKAIQNALGDRGVVVATISCGDNYFAERVEDATEEVIQLITPYQPDAVIAGPAFNAGRYGVSCGALCKAIHSRFGIPVVTGMSRENPAVELYRQDIYIIETADSVKGLPDGVTKMVNLICKLANNVPVDRSFKEGYFHRSLITNDVSSYTGAERVIAMLLNKLHGEAFRSEVQPPKYDRVNPAPTIQNIRSAVIALVTDGGLVPKGNPDKIEARGATHFGSYSIQGVSTLDPALFEVNHTGYDCSYVMKDPHRLVPLDIMRELENEGTIGKLYETFYSTAGAVGVLENELRMGHEMAQLLRTAGISGAVIIST